MATKKSLTKKSHHKPTKSTSTPLSKLGVYLKQREQFFADHPRGRVILGIFVVAVAILIGVFYRNFKIHQAVALYLYEEGIDYTPDL